ANPDEAKEDEESRKEKEGARRRKRKGPHLDHSSFDGKGFCVHELVVHVDFNFIATCWKTAGQWNEMGLEPGLRAGLKRLFERWNAGRVPFDFIHCTGRRIFDTNDCVNKWRVGFELVHRVHRLVRSGIDAFCEDDLLDGIDSDG